MSANQRDLLLYTLHRFAVAATGERLPFDRQALSQTLDESGIDSFRALIDLDDAGRRQIGLEVLEKTQVDRGGWINRRNASPGRLRPSMR